MIRFVFDVNEAGARLEQVPRCFYNFVTIYNNSKFDFTLFKGNSVSIADIIGACPAYTILTFPHDKLTDIVNFRWDGTPGTFAERCKIFFSEENMGLVGEFRVPQIITAAGETVIEERILFASNTPSGILLTASNKIRVDSMFFTNSGTTEARITLAHNMAGVNLWLLNTHPLGVGMTGSLSNLVLETGHFLNLTALVGIVTIIIYGVGR